MKPLANPTSATKKTAKHIHCLPTLAGILTMALSHSSLATTPPKKPTISPPSCRQPSLIHPMLEKKSDHGLIYFSGNSRENFFNGHDKNKGRIDFDGDGICDSLQISPLSDGTYDWKTADSRAEILFEHNDQVVKRKPGLPIVTIDQALPLYLSSSPTVILENHESFFTKPTVVRNFYRWNTATGRFETLSTTEAFPYARHIGSLLYTIALGGVPSHTVEDIPKRTLPWDRLPRTGLPAGPRAMEAIAALIEGHPVSLDFDEGLWTPERWSPQTRHLAFRVLLDWQTAFGGRNPAHVTDASLSRALGREYRTAPVARELSSLGVRNALLLLRELRREFPRAPEIAFTEAIVAMQAWKKERSLLGWRYRDALPDPRRTAEAALQVARDNYISPASGFDLALSIRDASTALAAGEALPMPAWTAQWSLIPLFQKTLDWPNRRPVP